MDVKEELLAIRKRNKQVESNKAWETSWSRRILITAMTYFLVVFFLWYVGLTQPWIAALVPALGFFLSTLTLPPAKKFWTRYIYKK